MTQYYAPCPRCGASVRMVRSGSVGGKIITYKGICPDCKNVVKETK